MTYRKPLLYLWGMFNTQPTTTKKEITMNKRTALNNRIKNRNSQIKVGGIYFLSSFYDKDGVFVKILAKSDKVNRCGFPSTITYEVRELVGDANASYYTIGKVGTCNATNLYEERALANHSKKRAAYDIFHKA